MGRAVVGSAQQAASHAVPEARAVGQAAATASPVERPASPAKQPAARPGVRAATAVGQAAATASPEGPEARLGALAAMRGERAAMRGERVAAASPAARIAKLRWVVASSEGLESRLDPRQRPARWQAEPRPEPEPELDPRPDRPQRPALGSHLGAVRMHSRCQGASPAAPVAARRRSSCPRLHRRRSANHGARCPSRPSSPVRDRQPERAE